MNNDGAQPGSGGRLALLGGNPTFDETVPIVRPWLPPYDRLKEEVRGILESGMLTKGRHLADFEEAIASHLGVEHAVAVSSCTVGLVLVYRALELTGEVVVPSFTFMASVSSLFYQNLTPTFCDVELETTNVDVDACRDACGPDTSAIVAVHNFGVPAAIDELEALAAERGVPLIFDAAHALGSLYLGEPVGAQGTAQVFSLSPTKLVIGGEGGVVTTDDPELAEAVRVGREYGNTGDYDSAFPGLNARMPEFNALLAGESLEMLEEAVENRRRYARRYREELADVPGIRFQRVDDRDRSSYKDFSVRVVEDEFGMRRDELGQVLSEEGVDTRAYYDPPVHRQTAYRPYAPPEGALLNTERLARESLSLPIWSRMPDGLVEEIAGAIRRAAGQVDEIRERLR